MAMSHAVTDTIADVMSEHPLTVGMDTTVAEVHALMEQHGVAACPVVTVHGELRGMISRVDMLRAVRPTREFSVFPAGEVANLPARELMRRGVVTVEPEDPLVAAVDLFVDTRLHVLPVVRRGPNPPVVVGVVSQGDALRHLLGTSPLAKP
jgi:CBS-domain-containing membrane protein